MYCHPENTKIFRIRTMPRIRVQHQEALSDDAFKQRYPDVEACRMAWFAWRWPEGFKCPVRRDRVFGSATVNCCSAGPAATRYRSSPAPSNRAPSPVPIAPPRATGFPMGEHDAGEHKASRLATQRVVDAKRLPRYPRTFA